MTGGAIITFCAICSLIFMWALVTAPHGVEDDQGFRLTDEDGRPPE